LCFESKVLPSLSLLPLKPLPTSAPLQPLLTHCQKRPKGDLLTLSKEPKPVRTCNLNLCYNTQHEAPTLTPTPPHPTNIHHPTPKQKHYTPSMQPPPSYTCPVPTEHTHTQTQTHTHTHMHPPNRAEDAIHVLST